MEEQQGEKPIFCAASAYGSTGRYLHKREKIDQAGQAYEKAYKIAADDINLLINRSNFCNDAFDTQQAIKDAEKALALDPRNLHALRALADAKFSNLEFEKSITLNFHGLQRRRKPGYFREGINRGVSCINETIGKSATNIMTHCLPLIEKHAKEVPDLDTPEEKKHVSRIPQPKRIIKKTPIEIHKKELLSRVLAYKYLEPLAIDKFYLQELVEDPRLESANKKSSKELKQLAKDALQMLTERQDMLHAQCLYYTLQQKQKTVSQRQNKYKKNLLRNERDMNTRQAQQFLRDIEACRKNNLINDMMRKVTNMQCFLDAKTSYTFPDKDHYIDRLYWNVGEGFLSLNRLSYTRSYQSNHRRVSFLMGLTSNRPTSYDSVIRNYPKRFDDPKEALKKALNTLETAENPNMRCWLYYEISQLQNALKNYPLSKFYAQNCQKEAEKFDMHVWWLNGCFSLISGDVQQGIVNEVINQALEAYKWAKKTNKAEETQQFLLHCVELANEANDYDSALDVKKRKNEILNVLDKDLAKDVRLLLDKISTVPPKRQFSVLPCKRPMRVDMESERTKYEQKNLTVVPGPPKKLAPVAHSCMPGLLVIR